MDIVRFTANPEAHTEAQIAMAPVARELAQLLPAAELRHVGTTAMGGGQTSGGLDVLLRVAPAEFAAAERLLASKYRRLGAAETDFARFDLGQRDYDVRVTVRLAASGGAHDDAHRFCALMRRRREQRAAYEALQASFDGKPRAAYREAQAAFIAEALANAGRPHRRS